MTILFFSCLSLLTALLVGCGSTEPDPSLPKFTGEWRLDDDTDPFTDEGFNRIILDATEDDVQAQFDVGLVVQCVNGNDLNVYVDWRKEVLGIKQWDARILVLDWRVDSEDLETQKWGVVDKQATFHPNAESAVEDLRRADRISVRVYSHDSLIDAKRGEGSQATAVFHSAGFADAYRPIGKACGT